MHDVAFIDAHVHLWELGRLRYPWLSAPFSDEGLAGSVEAIAVSYGPRQYLEDARHWNIVGAVHVDAGADPADALAETEWLESLAKQTGVPTGIVAFAALNGPDVEAVLEQQAAHSRVKGIRHIANWHANGFYTYTSRNLLGDPDWVKGFALLERYGLSFDLQAYPGQLSQAAELAARHPGIPVILNHCGMPIPAEDPKRAQWREGMEALAAVPHASVKISGFGITHHGWTAQSIRPYVLDTIEMFGVERCMFASDFPTDKLYSEFDRLMGAYTDIVSDFSNDQRRALFAGNADRIYRLGLDL